MSDLVACSMCGYRFDPQAHLACQACPVNQGCQVVCCPSCGYSWADPQSSVLARFDRDAPAPDPEDLVNTNGWMRPRLWGGKPGLPVTSRGGNLWETLGGKRKKEKGEKRRD